MPAGGVASNTISVAQVALVRAYGFCWELGVGREVCRHADSRVTGWRADTARLGV